MVPSESRQAPPWLLPLLLTLLVCSGICGLIYQVLWLRLLALTFGVTVHAAATVLSSFMGGLALGSLMAGRLADRSRHPLRLFGLVEIGIGLCAVVSPIALGTVQSLFVAAAPHLPDSLLIGTGIRTALSFAVLLVPTALMGATMPIVVKSSLPAFEGLGTRVSLLYAANTAGAIGGTLLAGLYLIPHLGLSKTFLLAAAINTTVGLTAILASYLLVPAVVPEPTTTKADATPIALSPVSPANTMVLVVSAISGFASLALEVVWFRVHGIFLGPTSYTFTLVLAMVLAGIAIGSALAAPLLRVRRLDWVAALAVLQLMGAVLILGSFTGLLVPESAPLWLERTLASVGIGFAAPAAAMSLSVVLPASIFFGLSFPIGLRLWAGAEGASGADTGRRVGLFYSVNVGGGILGSLAAGFVLLPLLGTRTSLIVLALLYVIAGVGLQLSCARRRPFLTGLVTASLVAIAWQVPQVPDPLEIMQRRIYAGRSVVWQDEGTQTTVAVVGDTNSRVLFLDGRHQANDSEAMTFIHRRIGMLPLVLHPQPARALVVGLGGGASPGGMSQFPGVQVDVVELSGGVVQAAGYFSHINFDILRNPAVHMRVDDGRTVLQRVRNTYDVITADAIIPRHAGANSLNSVEYFTLVRNALAPNGIALHWNGGATEEEDKLILRAFVTAFPHTTLWGDGALMVGSLTPLTVSKSRIEALLATPGTREALNLMHVESFDHLEKMFRADTPEIRAYLGEGIALSDDRPLLEYFASLPQTELNRTQIVRRPAGVIRP
jgi:spermidine synthase